MNQQSFYQVAQAITMLSLSALALTIVGTVVWRSKAQIGSFYDQFRRWAAMPSKRDGLGWWLLRTAVIAAIGAIFLSLCSPTRTQVSEVVVQTNTPTQTPEGWVDVRDFTAAQLEWKKQFDEAYANTQATLREAKKRGTLEQQRKQIEALIAMLRQLLANSDLSTLQKVPFEAKIVTLEGELLPPTATPTLTPTKAPTKTPRVEPSSTPTQTSTSTPTKTPGPTNTAAPTSAPIVFAPKCSRVKFFVEAQRINPGLSGEWEETPANEDNSIGYFVPHNDVGVINVPRGFFTQWAIPGDHVVAVTGEIVPDNVEKFLVYCTEK